MQRTMRLKQDVTMNYRDYGEITIPKGTPVTHDTACGPDESYYFVNEFSWIPTYSDGTKQHGLIFDASHYGINVPPEYIETV